MRKTLTKNLIAYALALAIVLFLVRGLSWRQLLAELQQANLWLFLPASALSFLLWFVGETYLYAKLFSYFHNRTTFREMAPANAVQYFLQVVNVLLGGTAMVAYLHKRKGVPWVAGGLTLGFQGFVDAIVMALMGLSGILVPDSIARAGWDYFVGAALLLASGVWFWLRGRPSSRPLQWIYDRPSMRAFRHARPRHYLVLGLIRAPIFIAQGIVFWVQLLSFGVHVSVWQVEAFMPAELILTALPFTPMGLGSLQAVLLLAFGRYGSRAALITMGLAISAMGLIFRLPLGIGAAGAYAREFLVTSGSVKPIAEAASLLGAS